MKLIREIVIYQKESDKFIGSFKINLPIDELIDILNVDIDEDPEVYMVYEINKEQYSKIKNIVPSLKEVDFNSVELFYECCQIS